MKVVSCFAVASVFLASSAHAQNQCDSYLGQTIAPITFEQAIARAKKAPSPKGEFETTAAYEARIAKESQGSVLIIRKIIEKGRNNYNFLKYDADKQEFVVRKYFFHDYAIPALEIFQHANNGVNANFFNIDMMISASEIAAGGGGKEKAKIKRTITAIFERESRDYKDGLFPGDSATIGYVPMDVERAKTFKPQARIAFVVAPKAPYVTRTEFTYTDQGIMPPTPVAVSATVLNADIQCALLTDDKNLVLGAFTTR